MVALKAAYFGARASSNRGSRGIIARSISGILAPMLLHSASWLDRNFDENPELETCGYFMTAHIP